MSYNNTIAYVRVSTEEQKDHGISIDSQMDKVNTYCKLNDLNLITIINDAGKSAKDLKRDGIQQLMDLSKRKQIKHIVVVKIDRLTRSTKDLLFLIEDIFTKNGIEFHSINEKIDTTSAQGKFFLTLMGAMATMERELIGERTSEALQFKRRSGFKLGQEPYGYKLSNGILIEDSQEISCINLMINLRDKGLSYQKVADYLNSHGISPKKSDKWFSCSVRSTIMHYLNYKQVS